MIFSRSYGILGTKHMLRIYKIICFVFSVFAVMQLGANDASADMGPEPADLLYPGGAIQASSSATRVSMEYEKVILTYRLSEKYSFLLPAHVSAIFKMKNNGPQTETMNVYFPVDYAISQNVSREKWEGSISNFKVKGKLIPEGNKTTITRDIDGRQQELAVYRWEEIFRPGEISEVNIEYDATAGSRFGSYSLSYVLGTGRDWWGNIEQGEIVFVLPETLPSWAINGLDKLPFVMSDNRITVTFTNYEPLADEVVTFEIYDFNTVKNIEELKQELSAFNNVLKIASLYGELTQGFKCSYCRGPLEDALGYYDLAIDKASSKEELNAVLISFSGLKLEYILNVFTLKTCKESDMQCLASLYLSRDGLYDTPFRLPDGANEVNNSIFLKKYADKMRQYDPAFSNSVNNFLSRAKEVSEWSKTHNYWDEPQPEEKQDTTAVTKEPEEKQNIGSPNTYISRWLQTSGQRRIVIICVLLLISLLALLFLIRFKRPES